MDMTQICPGGSRSDSSTRVSAKTPSRCACINNSSLCMCIYMVNLKFLKFLGVQDRGRSVNPAGINPVWLCTALPSCVFPISSSPAASQALIFSPSHTHRQRWAVAAVTNCVSSVAGWWFPPLPSCFIRGGTQSCRFFEFFFWLGSCMPTGGTGSQLPMHRAPLASGVRAHCGTRVLLNKVKTVAAVHIIATPRPKT